MGATEQGADATKGRWLTIPRTLCFVINGDDVLLMKRGPHRRVFPNKYNGVGGHIERGEDPASGALREINEETGLDVHSLRLRGVYNIDAGAETGIVLFIYTAISDARGPLIEGDEGTLYWVHKDEALSLDLVEDLPYLLPRVLDDGAPMFSAHVSYDDNDDIDIKFVTE